MNRLKISHALDGGRPLSGRVQNHIQRCSSCRTFYRSSATLPERLGPALGEPVSGRRMADRVMAEVGGRSLPRATGHRPRRLALAASLLLTLAIGWYGLAALQKENRVEEEASAAMEAVSDLGKKWMNRCIPDDGQIPLLTSVAAPMNEEVERLTRDVQSMQRFLQNLLPMAIGALRNRTNDGGL